MTPGKATVCALEEACGCLNLAQAPSDKDHGTGEVSISDWQANTEKIE